MNADTRPHYGRQRRSGSARDGRGLGRGRRRDGSTRVDSSLGARTAKRALLAAGAYVAQDLRDRDGVTQPLLRRAALRMVVSRQAAIRRVGSAYLRSDPPAPQELPEARAAEPLQLPPGKPGETPPAGARAGDAQAPV